MPPSHRPILHLVPAESPPAPRAHRDAGEFLFRAHGRYVAGIAFNLLGRHDEVDDLVQDVFLSATRFSGDIRDPTAVRSWLTTITVRLARRRLVSRRLRTFVGLDALSGHDQLVAPEASPELRALAAQLYKVLDRVPILERTAWCLRHLQDMQLEEVAAACGCSLATAKRRIAAVQARVSDILESE